MFYLLLWLILAIVVGMHASSKGRFGLAYTLIALFLSPLVGFIITMIIPPNIEKLEKRQLATGTMKLCLYCSEIIKKEAKICKHCHSEVKRTFKV